MNFTMTIQHGDVQVSISSAKAMNLAEMSTFFNSLTEKATKAVAANPIFVNPAPNGLKKDGTPAKKRGRPAKKAA